MQGDFQRGIDHLGRGRIQRAGQQFAGGADDFFQPKEVYLRVCRNRALQIRHDTRQAAPQTLQLTAERRVTERKEQHDAAEEEPHEDECHPEAMEPRVLAEPRHYWGQEIRQRPRPNERPNDRAHPVYKEDRERKQPDSDHGLGARRKSARWDAAAAEAPSGSSTAGVSSISEGVVTPLIASCHSLPEPT